MNYDSGEYASAHVAFRTESTSGVRYTCGSTIYDEALIDGRLVDRYWAADGYIKAEFDLPPEKRVRGNYISGIIC